MENAGLPGPHVAFDRGQPASTAAGSAAHRAFARPLAVIGAVRSHGEKQAITWNYSGRAVGASDRRDAALWSGPASWRNPAGGNSAFGQYQSASDRGAWSYAAAGRGWRQRIAAHRVRRASRHQR